MSLVTGKAAFKNALLALAANTDPDKTSDEALDQFINALETYIKSATVTVPGTGLVAGPNPVTGISNTGGLS